MEIREPSITRGDILRLEDDSFHRDNVCIVTGAGTGIGRATAIAAAANGLTVVGVDINEEEGEKTREMAHKMGGRMVFVRADLTRDREIEDCLMKHAAVAMVAVVGSPDPVRGEVVKAFIVPKVGVSPDEGLAAEIRSFVKTRLAAHEYPREIEFVDELPMTTTGKIMRRELKKLEMERKGAGG